MAAELKHGQSPHAILQAIAATPGIPEQVILNRAAGYADYALSPQATLNKRAGRAEHALTYQEALKANTGFVGNASTQEILIAANNAGKTISNIVTGV